MGEEKLETHWVPLLACPAVFNDARRPNAEGTRSGVKDVMY